MDESKHDYRVYICAAVCLHVYHDHMYTSNLKYLASIVEHSTYM